MKGSTILAGALFAAVAARAVAAPPAKDAGPDFKTLLKKTAAAWQTLDPAKAAPFYAKDAALAFFDIAPLKYTGWSDYQSDWLIVHEHFSIPAPDLSPPK